MNVQVEGTDLEQEDQIPARAEQTEDERQAEADMLAGFAGTADEPKEEVKDEPKDETPAEVKTEPPPEKTELATALEALAGLQKQYRDLAGHFGGMKQVVDSLKETVKAASKSGQEAPSQQQVADAVEAAAAGDYDELNAIAEDFPDLGTALKKAMARQAAEITKQIPKVDANAIADQAAEKAASKASTTVEAAVAKARKLAVIDLAHDGWEETVNTPEFGKWLEAQPAETQALASSDKPKDSIKLLDAFKAHREAAAAEAARKQSQTRRLASAVPVKSTGAAGGPQVLDDEAAFLEGFKTG